MQIEEAIADLKYYIGEDPYFNGTYDPVTDFEKYCYNNCKAIDTVLNELEKKDNKIKELEGRCKNLDIEAQSYLEELMGDSTLKNRTIKQLNSELEKKDTVIDLMAEWLYGDDTSFGYGKLKNVNTPNRIKQYFYKKASDNK